ncbi:hypothetical protein EJC51_45580 [Streptomyces aquilus]|uniref:Uncharacterized protein n=1 Tax=Streptomyces aquilus TaxID=2548456 RepID=A0A3Q9C3N3_9ACTN|nr:hypothetical protein [Streptomyces aquilus]AZP22689.1 hypothetical protein EJC51_45580 [Streptomyces aquilus]
MSDLLWIPVPGGFVNGKPLLRVLVVPRLDGGSLAQHGMAAWPPAALTTGTVRVELFHRDAGPSAAPDAVRSLTPVVPFQQGVWKRLVAGLAVEDTSVRQDGVDTAQLVVSATSEEAAAVAQAFHTAAKAKVTPEQGPQSGDFVRCVRKVLSSTYWLNPPAQPPAPPKERQQAQPPAGKPGFHRALSLLREHPAVLRALGLVFELTLTPGDVTHYAGGSVRVAWPGKPAPLPVIASPRTIFGTDFRPGATPRISGGMVQLDRTDDADRPLWQVVTVDVDVAVQRMREAARAEDAHPSETPTLPYLRSSGLQLVLRGRGEEMRERLERAAARNGALPDVLTADDLVLGYRIDVCPTLGGTDWFSLHRRRATYTIRQPLADGPPVGSPLVIGVADGPEEGHTKTNAAISDWTGLHADEIVASWRGGSLAVPRPPIDGSPPATPPLDPGLDLGTSFRVEPGSLPPLRFGRQYTLRARVADVAGGGLALGDAAADQHSTEPEVYARHEPLPAPIVAYPVATSPLGVPPGEAAERVVIRSDPMTGLDVAAYSAKNGYAINDKRLLRLPDGTPDLAERHGMFDLAGDPAVATHVTWQWVRRALLAPAPEAAPDEASEAAEQPRLPDPAAGGIVVARGDTNPPVILRRAWADLEAWPDLPPKTLHLTTPEAGSPLLTWEAERLVARLEPGRQLTLDMSTFPREGITDAFALQLADPPEYSSKAFGQGRHPLATPARRVTLVHAVQHPLRVPETALTVTRAAGCTFAELKPQSDVFDPKSTAELHVTARWEDQMDGRRQEATDVPVQTLTIDPDGPARPATLFRHEFGDTRHRTVTYTLKAISRFREYFRNPELVDEFTVAKELVPVSVPSSARPDPPVVVSARPAFLWRQSGDLDAPSHTLTRERLAGRIRVALRPPWNSSGAGELLAVVTRPEGANLDDKLSAYVSEAGSDPLYPTPGLPAGSPFPPQVSSATGPDARLRLPEAAADVIVKPHQPEYHEDDGLWSCDVALTGTEGTPLHNVLVSLAVARYQPDSLAGLSLSPVVRTDTVPLLPDRTVRVTRLADRFSVKLTGSVSQAAAVNKVDMILERCNAPIGVTPAQVDLIGFDATATGVPAWHLVALKSPTPKKIGLTRVREWTREFVPPPGPGALRVRIREVELIPNGPSQQNTVLKSGTPDEIKERIVFTDTVMLPEI